MRFEVAGNTDIGSVKESNQDAYLLKVAEVGGLGDVALVAVADGMGGLSKGELASATVIRALSDWFEQALPSLLEDAQAGTRLFERSIARQWNTLVQDLNVRIIRYGLADKINLGTTLTAMLAAGGRYSIVHVGDSRAYEVSDGAIRQLTDDQTFVKREVDAGRMTPEEAVRHPKRNVLLQCIGASKRVVPSIIQGNLDKEATYLLCSDGFRHVLTHEDFDNGLSPRALRAMRQKARRDGEDARRVLGRSLEAMTRVVMGRGERDNITAAALVTEGASR